MYFSTLSYNQLLKWSRTEDLSDVARCRAVYSGGVDYSGSPVVVCIGKNFPTNMPEHKVTTHSTHSTHAVHTQYTHSTHTVHTEYTHAVHTHSTHTQFTHSTQYTHALSVI